MNLLKECERVLNQNWRGGYTVPSPNLYPFQWNWDSGFIALGWIHVDPEKAIQELEHLFMGQWKNGFLPHIVFHNAEKYGTGYYPSADVWNSSVSPLAPSDVRTTGISQPPIHGVILEQIIQKVGMNDRLVSLFKKVIKLHLYYYERRDTLKNGLVNVWHNWETGMDNSPWWDASLDRVTDEDIAHIVLDRKDTKVVKDYKETRPSDQEYKRYMWLVEALRGRQYESIEEEFPFQVFDLAFNSIFLASGESLARVGRHLEEEVQWLEELTEKGKRSFNHLMWDDVKKRYHPYDLISQQQVPLLGAASFLPLFANIPDQAQAENLVRQLGFNESLYAVPSFHQDQIQYELKKYWRGPVWVNLNYMIWKGLENYGFHQQANTLKEKTIQMVKRLGIREYYPVDAKAQHAFGAHDFSWTASIMLDLLNE